MRGMSDVGSNQDVARPPEPSELSGSVHGSFSGNYAMVSEPQSE